MFVNRELTATILRSRPYNLECRVLSEDHHAISVAWNPFAEHSSPPRVSQFQAARRKRGCKIRIDGGEIYEVQDHVCGSGSDCVRCTCFPQSDNPAPVINQRKENQQDRIANGVGSCQLTASETRNLEKRDDGNLTAADKARLTRQQNRLSGSIYRDKHNGAVENPDPKSEVGQRQRNQQERIAQAIKSGQLTAGEAAHMEGREAAVNHEIAATVPPTVER
jgi:hypothetical protein